MSTIGAPVEGRRSLRGIRSVVILAGFAGVNWVQGTQGRNSRIALLFAGQDVGENGARKMEKSTQGQHARDKKSK